MSEFKKGVENLGKEKLDIPKYGKGTNIFTDDKELKKETEKKIYIFMQNYRKNKKKGMFYKLSWYHYLIFFIFACFILYLLFTGGFNG